MKINSELRFEIMTTCCAALGGGLVAAAVSWFSPWKEWTAQAGLGVGILCGFTAVAFHLLVRELGKADEEGYFRRGIEQVEKTANPPSIKPRPRAPRADKFKKKGDRKAWQTD